MQEWLKGQLSLEVRLKLLASPECLESMEANAKLYSKIVRAFSV